MKRYKGEVVVYWLEGAKVEMKEDPDGEWVRWENVKERIREAYKEGYFTGQNSGDIKIKGEMLNYPKCNCEKMARDALPGSYWLCPIHGYKRR